MKKIEKLSILGIMLLPILVLQGCYTQLAFDNRIVVEKQSGYQSQEKYPSQSESIPDTLQEGEISPDIIVEKHYWLLDPYGQQFGYDPFFGDISFYHSFHLTYYDSYWYPGHYARHRPYWSGYYYAGWNCYDPFWYDPYWSFAYYPGYYSGYGYAYWGGYQPAYIADPIPDKKRDWDRRGADLTHNTIVRPSNSSAGQGYLANVIARTETGTSTIKRNETDITKPIRRTENDSEIKKPRIHKRDNIEDKSQTIKRIYHIVSHSNRSGNNNNKSKNSKNTTLKRNTGSHSNHTATKTVRHSISRSNTRNHSKSYSTRTSHSGKTRGGSSKSRSRK